MAEMWREGRQGLQGPKGRAMDRSFSRPWCVLDVLAVLALLRPPHVGQPHPWRRALAQDVAPEAEQLGRAPSGLGVELAGPLDQAGVLDQTAEVLLVETHAGERLDDPLELEQGEGGRQELEDDRAVLELPTQPT